MVLTKSEVKARYISQSLTAQEADQAWDNAGLQNLLYCTRGQYPAYEG